MVVLSKLFREGIQQRQCFNDLVHPETCTVNALHDTYRFLISNAKYFAPVIMLPLLVKIKKLNSDILKDTLKYYLETVVTGAAVGWNISLWICVFRHLLGEFKYSTFLFLPTAIGGGTMTYLSTPRVIRLYKTSVFQCYIESVLLKRKNFVTRAVSSSVFLQTAIFMCCSALILQAKQDGLYKGFWLLTPNEQVTQSSKATDDDESKPTRVCSHQEEHCATYLLRGLRNYVAIGFTLDLIKMSMSKVPPNAQGFGAKLLAKLANLRLSSSALLASYMGIYRFAHCSLNRKTNADPHRNHLLAAFLGGSCYIFYAKPTLFCYALVASIQILWQKFETDKSNERHEVVKWIKQIPFSWALFPVLLGYLVHTYCLRPRYISSLGETIINGLTDNYAKRIGVNVQQIERLMEAELKRVGGTFHK